MIPYQNIYNSDIGEGTKVGAYTEIGNAKVGKDCKIQAFVFICKGVTIEDEVFVGPHTCFTNDLYPHATGDWKITETLVKKGASIGANSTILCGVTIGENAMIGCGSVVTKNVPDNGKWIGDKLV